VGSAEPPRRGGVGSFLSNFGCGRGGGLDHNYRACPLGVRQSERGANPDSPEKKKYGQGENGTDKNPRAQIERATRVTAVCR